MEITVKIKNTAALQRNALMVMNVLQTVQHHYVFPQFLISQQRYIRQTIKQNLEYRLKIYSQLT